ncbi:MAG TPA: hypothetical protein VK715_06215 [Steroidobacteraceae bacterium]|jgi:hypothetical protein|nr:hypothetical protein [Steroidobacteraceae bacterium]
MKVPLMKVLISAVFAAGLLAGCAANPSSPSNTTVVVPQGGSTTCENGNPPPCD